MGEVGEQGVAVGVGWERRVGGWGGGRGGGGGLINDTFDWTKRDQFPGPKSVRFSKRRVLVQWRIKNGTCEEPEQFKQFGVHYRAKGRAFQEACLPPVNDGKKLNF